MPTFLLTNRLKVRDRHQDYVYRVVFYQVEIVDKIWITEKTPGSSDADFSFPWQTEYWNGTAVDDDHHKLFSSINYQEANENNYGDDYKIDAEFDDYDSAMFTTVKENDDDEEDPHIWIKKIDLGSEYWDDNEVIKYSFTRKTFLVATV